MDIIPVVLQPQLNEFLYSYLLRLAKANGFEDFNSFASCFLYETNHKHSEAYSMKYFINLEESLHMDHEVFYNLIKNHSIYLCSSMFLSPQQQTELLNVNFRKYRKDSKLWKEYTFTEIKELIFCPKCQKEEIKKNGFFYYHKEHQFVNVKVCTKHKCVLHKCTCEFGHEFDENFKSEPFVIDTDFEAEFIYAMFVESLIEAELDTNIDEINFIITNKLKDLKFTFSDFNEHIKCSKLSTLYSFPEKFDFADQTISFKRNNTINIKKDILVILMELFDSISNIPFVKKEPSKEWLEMIHKDGYELVSPFRENILTLRHATCGTNYITTADSFTKGWQCPTCDLQKSDEKIIGRLVRFVGNQKYEFIDEFKKWNKSVYIRHISCGNEYKVLLRVFFNRGARCCCEEPESLEEIRDYVEKNGDFKLLEYNYKSRICTIRCNYCGQIFEIKFNKFWNDKQCIYCNFRLKKRQGKPMKKRKNK